MKEVAENLVAGDQVVHDEVMICSPHSARLALAKFKSSYFENILVWGFFVHSININKLILPPPFHFMCRHFLFSPS